MADDSLRNFRAEFLPSTRYTTTVMDLLLTPADPAFPTEDTPYLAGDKRWNCGHFASYAGPNPRSAIESLEALPDEELNGFLQTWLFFGLVAEFLGLNEQQDGKHIVDPSQAQSELDDLYKESVIIKADGKSYITGVKVLALVPLVQERIRTAAGIAGGIEQRLVHLDHCVCYMNETAFSRNIMERLDYNIRYSLAALGELLSAAIVVVIRALDLQVSIKGDSRYWGHKYLVRGGWLESQMVAHGWCYSEVEKVRKHLHELNAMHYVSRLRKFGPRRDHYRCHKQLCVAFQIRMHEYQPAHVEQDCGCKLLSVDLNAMLSILEKRQSFPVLTGKTAWSEVYKRDEVQVEAFEPAIPYVAISHVWADGLGNPTANTLPGCQVDRLISLVANLQNTVDPDWKERGQPPYRIWIDSLCCPVESKGKSIALERIADVYRNAAHVLVLDSSLTSFPSEAVDPAELLFRALSCSPWMRRLWTFQEGALARSLYYQFADCAMTGRALLSKVAQARDEDIRYGPLLFDLAIEFRPFERFSPHIEPIQGLNDTLWELQRALYSRSVSVPRDEPLCIATLLGLDVGRILAENGEHATHKRMALVWEMIARRLGGIPPNVIFSVDKTLDVIGFRWAPRSLLAAEIQRCTVDTDDPYAERAFFDSAPELVQLENGFSCKSNTKLAQLISESSRKGLRGSYPGFKVYARPYSGVATAPEQYRLQPWDAFFAQSLSGLRLFLKEEETCRWYKVWSLPIWTEKHSVADICKAVHTGHCAMIRVPTESAIGLGIESLSHDCLMVLIKQEDDTELIVRRQFTVYLTVTTKEESILAEKMTELAEELASEQVTTNFIATRDQAESDEYMLAELDLWERIEELIAEALEASPDFANAVKEVMGERSLPFIWKYLAMYHSHQTILERLPEDQIWLVD